MLLRAQVCTCTDVTDLPEAMKPTDQERPYSWRMTWCHLNVRLGFEVGGLLPRPTKK